MGPNRKALTQGSSSTGNLASRKANQSFVVVTPAWKMADSTRQIQISMFFPSKFGSSGFLIARSWEFACWDAVSWVVIAASAAAAADAASVADLAIRCSSATSISASMFSPVLRYRLDVSGKKVLLPTRAAGDGERDPRPRPRVGTESWPIGTPLRSCDARVSRLELNQLI